MLTWDIYKSRYKKNSDERVISLHLAFTYISISKYFMVSKKPFLLISDEKNNDSDKEVEVQNGNSFAVKAIVKLFENSLFIF